MDISKMIKSRRLELGLTLKDVASALGTAESTISRYESSNIQNMGIDKIEALAKVLQCTPGYLMGWENNSTAPQTIAAHLDTSDLTQDEIDDVADYIAFIKNKRKSKNGL
ncbi:helix-turn-helix domain-containing protein [Faecalicatena sp. AGMB00832]|uniref:Helix-turn-helix domain-containing protein n=1 Tax=Faecalicatena faecalis TaxID=2726362 RepID=A0ABS6D5J7_9FIRM|nr:MULTISPECIES: helix-turn-helix transcriptional regulator [Faecalicatena]MBU3876565.1 helix-turn-helix domain-containing protein [Faecalicatena faecalis]MCI6464606.1 helix-turn-helix domain-containing protein [Faecalicatena sp.]MDY5618184.1 helix-turn-helix transcriptional regulator [Lachnospiraceae bacterium]